MPPNVKFLYAVELDVSIEAAMQGSRHRIGPDGYWVIRHAPQETGPDTLCVFLTAKEAQEETKWREHESRVAKFVRVIPKAKKRKKRKLKAD
jgi:hypothetical protein